MGYTLLKIESKNGTPMKEGVIDLGQLTEEGVVATIYSPGSNVAWKHTMKVAYRTVDGRRTAFKLVDEGSIAFNTNMLHVTASKHMTKGEDEKNVVWVDENASGVEGEEGTA